MQQAFKLPTAPGQPTVILENPGGLKDNLTTVPGIISALIPVLFMAAGLILFAMLIWGGFDLLLSGGDKHKAETARSRITMAIIGFILVFLSYWVTQFLLNLFHLQ